jgi:putative ABC transport system permease protein
MHALRLAARTLARAPLFTTAAVLTLALGLGATTAIFTVVNGVLLRPLPYPHPDRLVRLWAVGAKGGRMNFSDPDFEDLRDQSRSFTALAEVSGSFPVSVAGTAEPARANAALVSNTFFQVMGVAPIRGRLFLPEEQHPGGRPAVVVSEGFWRSALGGAPLGPNTTLAFDDRVFAVVGVMPSTLDYPVGTALWLPRELEDRNPHRTAHNFGLVGRLAPGVPLDRARAEIRAIARRLKLRYGDQTDMADAALVPLRDQLVGHTRRALLVLLGASSVLLLIACANVVNLLIVRVAARSGEYAVRLALGAMRTQLARQFVAEALVLAAGGGGLGVLLAAGGVHVLLAFQRGDLPRVGEIHLSWPVLLFALSLSMLAALAIGLFTAYRAERANLREALAGVQRAQAAHAASTRVRRTLAIAQVAAALVLLVGTGLLGRSFLALLSVDPGFRTEHALVLTLSPPWASDAAGEHRTIQLYDELLARLRGIPGVRGVGAVNSLPLTDGTDADGTFLILPRPEIPRNLDDLGRLFHDPSRTGHAEFRLASAGYFRAMGIPLLRGRLFDERDAPDAPHVAVISRSLAERRWPNDDPIGKVIEFGNMDGDLRPFTIVGVVGDVRETSLAAPPLPTIYAFYRQRPRTASTMTIVIQGPNVETPTVVAAARRAVRELAPDVPPRVQTIESVISASVADRRFTLLLIGTFGTCALLLATLGVYGVVSYLVTLRRQEIGVRIALGAQVADVVLLVLREGALLAAAGIGLGAVVALLATRFVAGLLYGVSSTDPLAFAAVAIGLGAMVLLASAIPARRAARVEAMSILRGT